jgi:hypothetical protein
MAENIQNRLEKEVNSYNELNKKKVGLENQLGTINQEMLKILGKIELLQDLDKINESEKDKDNKST